MRGTRARAIRKAYRPFGRRAYVAVKREYQRTTDPVQRAQLRRLHAEQLEHTLRVMADAPVMQAAVDEAYSERHG